MSDPIHIYLVIWAAMVIGIIIGVYANERLWAFILWFIVGIGGGLITFGIVFAYALKGMGLIS